MEVRTEVENRKEKVVLFINRLWFLYRGHMTVTIVTVT